MQAVLTRARRSVGQKFALLITLCTATVVATSVVLVLERFGAQDEIRAKQAAHETATRLCAAVDGVFQGAFEIVETTNANVVALKDDGITDPRSTIRC